MNKYPEIQIREFAPDDFPAVEAFWNENGLGGSHRGDTPEVICNTIKSGAHLLLMIDDCNILVGTSWLTNDRRRTYLHHFGIAGSHRGRGLAKLLLEKSIEIARADGYQIKIEVHRDNLPALKLYADAGFCPLGDYDVFIIRDLSAL